MLSPHSLGTFKWLYSPTKNPCFNPLPLVCLLWLATACNTRETPPNIVYINIDDLGWTDLGCYGSGFYETPNIDALSEEGMMFTRAYASAANCAPSRACLISGQNTPRHGIFTVGNSDRGKSKDRRIIPAENNTVLPDSVVTLAETLKLAGYTTGTFGKWHLSDDPTTQGFDVNVAGSHRGSPHGSYFSPYDMKHIEDGPDGEYLTDRLTAEALQFLDTHREKPFFLYLPYYTVHTPLMTKEALVDKYREKTPTDRHAHPVYAGMIEAMDTNVGKILEKIDELGLAENTLVILTSDNGGIRAVSRQTPLRAGKGSYYEGGIRVPLIVRWPEKIAPRSHSAVPVSNLDIYPTILSILQQPPPQGQPLDGQSILPLLQEMPEKFPERDLVWHFPIYLQAYDTLLDDGRDPLFRTRPGSVLLSGHWKLHEYYEDKRLELYNLAADPSERIDLASQELEKLDALYSKLQAWKDTMNAPIPTEINPQWKGMEEQ